LSGVDILLANSYFLAKDRKHQRIEGPFPPLGLLCLASVLRENGYNAEVFDGTFESGNEAFGERIDDNRAKTVGIYSTVVSRRQALEMAHIAKRRGCRVLAGGPDPSSSPTTYIAGGVDVVGIGEGEETIVELMEKSNGGDLSGVRGVAYSEKGILIQTQPRPYIADLDAFPLPARDLIDMPAYLDFTRRIHGVSQTTAMTSRGCPFKCTWCAKPVFGNRYRHRSPAKVAEELVHLKQVYHPEQIRFADDVFTLDRKITFQLCDEIERKGAIIPFECLSRVDLIDEELLDRLKQIGCRRILYGIESGSQKVLHSMKKGITLGDITEISGLTKAKGIEQYWFLIFGYPGEDGADIKATINLVRSLVPNGFGITVAYPLPGTEFHEMVRTTLREGAHWTIGRDNALLYKARYPASFYRACIYGTRAVHAAATARSTRPGSVSRLLDKVVACGIGAMVDVFDAVRAGEDGELQAEGQ